jgi:hypothetical protein
VRLAIVRVATSDTSVGPLIVSVSAMVVCAGGTIVSVALLMSRVHPLVLSAVSLDDLAGNATWPVTDRAWRVGALGSSVDLSVFRVPQSTSSAALAVLSVPAPILSVPAPIPCVGVTIPCVGVTIPCVGASIPCVGASISCVRVSNV